LIVYLNSYFIGVKGINKKIMESKFKNQYQKDQK